MYFLIGSVVRAIVIQYGGSIPVLVVYVIRQFVFSTFHTKNYSIEYMFIIIKNDSTFTQKTN